MPSPRARTPAFFYRSFLGCQLGRKLNFDVVSGFVGVSWVVLSDIVWCLVSLLIHGSGSPGALLDLFEGLHGHACEVSGKPFLFHEVVEI